MSNHSGVGCTSGHAGPPASTVQSRSPRNGIPDRRVKAPPRSVGGPVKDPDVPDVAGDRS